VTRDPRELPENYQCVGGVSVPSELCALLGPFAARIARGIDSSHGRALLHAIRSEGRAFEAEARRLSPVGRPIGDIPCRPGSVPSGSVREELTAAEVAVVLGVTERTVTRWAKANRFPGRFRAGRWSFRPEDVEQLKEH
jgi:excisionase family DNA binding protein